MKKATTVYELFDVLKPEPIKFDTMAEFYCDKTNAVRTGDEFGSPTADILDAIVRGDAQKAFLFMGHRGCGKSTELNELCKQLKEKDYDVVIIESLLEIDMQNAAYWDLLVLISKELIEIAAKHECKIDTQLLARMENFWSEIVKEDSKYDTQDLEINAGVGANTPFFSIINIFTNLTANIKHTDEKRTTIRKEVEKKAALWLQYVNTISDAIALKRNGKRPIIVLEDLDKLDAKIAWAIFQGNAQALSQMPAHVIYTFPIALSYSAMFRSVSDYFRTEILPMIKIKQINGDVYLPGIEAIKNILSLRFELSLFKEKALNRAIMSTGGSLRDLFKILADAATRAGRRNSEIIELEDVNIALNKLSSTLTRMIETNNYKLLIKIHESEIEKQKIENRDNSLELMQAMVLLEYNTKRWCDVHPLVVEFLEGLGEIE